MTPEIAAAVAAGADRGEAPEVAMRHHLLEGLLRRLAASSVVEDFVVRGGLVTRMWAPGRATRDLDLVGDHTFDLEATSERLRTIGRVPVDDGLRIDPLAVRTQGIWLHTDFPGVRAHIPVTFGTTVLRVTADVGFGDPLVPAATWVDYPALVGPPPRVRACAPECQVSWKLHGLAENEARFRPKDLADLARILAHQTLDAARMPAAIEAAFISRGFTVHQARTILDAPFWASGRARARWREAEAPGQLAPTLQAVRTALQPFLDALPDSPDPSG
ncbi:MAG: nucleotidyl transferase AbiEii/AbiGii toxin family protein [Myxococcota bacterium]